VVVVRCCGFNKDRFGGDVSHPEIPISECEPFFSINLNFLKDLFKIILFEFIFN
jgi:hypothetical protein